MQYFATFAPLITTATTLFMVTLEEALLTIENAVKPLPAERVSLPEASGRVLSEEVVADMDMPPFDKAAVDGFACRYEDIHNTLTVIETVNAGKMPQHRLEQNQCSRIMTGGVVPAGADCVLMVEDTLAIDDFRVRFVKEKTSRNICYRGEDVKKDTVVLKPGLIIRSQHIAAMAAFGYAHPLVSKKVRVGILSTGDELVEPDCQPSASQIRNSNAWQLIAQSNLLPAVTIYGGIIIDDPESTATAIGRMISQCDLLIISGGISMGDTDYVPESLLNNGFRFHFRSMAVQPGRPTIFASRSDGKVCFALPGNPVSSFNQFELLVKQAIYHFMGHKFQAPELYIPIAKDYNRKKSGRLSLVPVAIINNSTVLPVEYHGSAHIQALSGADGLMFIPIGTTHISKGDLVRVRLF